MDALVTDTHDRAALAGLRGLGRAGIRAIALSPERTGPGLWSRYAEKRIIGPDATRDARGFAEKIREIFDEHGERIVYPGREEAIDALLHPSAPLSLREALPYPSLDGLAAVRDKGRLPELAAGAGLATPQTVFQGPLGDLVAAGIELPVVVKSAHAVGNPPRPCAVRTSQELERLAAGATEDDTVVVQELRPGPLAAIAVVLDADGSIAARFQQRTAATWPPTMGVSALAQSVEPDGELVERVAEMLRSVDYSGLAQVQLLEGPGGPVVIDVNPRYYGSLPLALAAGVNLPAIWHACASGESPGGVPDYRVGVVFRWFEASLFALARGSARSGEEALGRAGVGAVWARDDPLASVAAVTTTVRGALSKRLGRSESS